MKGGIDIYRGSGTMSVPTEIRSENLGEPMATQTITAENRVAYSAGWRARERAGIAPVDLSAAEIRYERKHHDPDGWFAAGWVDCSAGNDKGAALRNERT